jgi:integrase/recombinase XerD
MATTKSERADWSEAKQMRLQEQLSGQWAEDTWDVVVRKNGGTKSYLHFPLASEPLKWELKYAIWHHYHSGAWKLDSDQRTLCCEFSHLTRWLNTVAPHAPSLMIHTLEYWEVSLRTYLTQLGRYKRRQETHLRANQQYRDYETEDRRICLFRRLYRTIVDAYDDREETDKDIWDLRKLGVAVNLTGSNFHLNFSSILQPWLRTVTKDFMKYNMAIHSAGDCFSKLGAIRAFSHFLAQHAPGCQLADIDRSLVLAYLQDVQGQVGPARYNGLLYRLRVFLETCAHRLQIAGLTKEQLIFDDDFAKQPEYLSREIPEEVLIQLRSHLDALPTTILRMVVILLEVGMRISELCTLPLDCLICDDKHEWYLRSYQSKAHKEHIVPLVDGKVVGTIQAQQQEIRTQWGNTCPYLFPTPLSHIRPYKKSTFERNLNTWAVKHEIKDSNQVLWRFQAHQFRHTVGMRLINEDVPLEVISRLLGHATVRLTERYARKRAAELRKELERVARKRKTVDYQGRAVKGDPQANDPEAQMVRKGIRGQTLPVGGCGRLIVLGACNYANKCLTCPMWLTSTDDLPALTSFYERAVRLRQRGTDAGNQVVVQQQEHIIATLAVRIKSLEATEMDSTLCVDDVLAQLHTDLAEAESGLEEAREAGLLLAAKHLERTITDLKARIAALEEPA